MSENTAEVQISEMTINSINLRFEDRKSGDVKDEGKTKPEVILRQVLSQPGQVLTASLVLTLLWIPSMNPTFISRLPCSRC